MTTWTLSDDSGNEETIEAEDLRKAMAMARAWADGDWDTESGPVFVDVDIADENGNTVAWITEVFDQDEPHCLRGETHDWEAPHELVGGIAENPGVQGNGGGVICTEVCMVCGCARVTDSWATNPNNGTQGHTTVSYATGAYDIVADMLDHLDVGDMPQSSHVEGDGWATFVAEGPGGWWASVVADDHDLSVEWHRGEDDARGRVAGAQIRLLERLTTLNPDAQIVGFEAGEAPREPRLRLGDPVPSEPAERETVPEA
jgi:hypothetical protein